MPDTLDIFNQISEAFIKLTDELSNESDRGSVVLAFAWIEDELTLLLKKFCLPSKSVTDKADELFGTSKGALDAASKIELA